MDLVFKDLKVVELASVLAGPSVGMFFAELGAQVVKVENPETGGDVTRGWLAEGEQPREGLSAYYTSVNWGKESVFIDIKEAAGRLAVYKLIEGADVVISNFKPSSAKALGFDYESIKAVNASVIVAEIQGFPPELGEDRVAFDVVLQAECGFMYMNGEPDGNFVKMPVALIDVLAGHQLKEGVLVALLNRYKTGLGCCVQVSLYDAALASLANQATNWLNAGVIPERMGSKHPNIAPYGDVFRTSDGVPLVVAAGTQKQFEVLMQSLNLESWLHDSRIISNKNRVTNRTYLCKIIQAGFDDFDAETIYNQLIKEGVPVGKIKNMKVIFDEPYCDKLLMGWEANKHIGYKTVKSCVFNIRT